MPYAKRSQVNQVANDRRFIAEREALAVQERRIRRSTQRRLRRQTARKEKKRIADEEQRANKLDERRRERDRNTVRARSAVHSRRGKKYFEGHRGIANIRDVRQTSPKVKHDKTKVTIDSRKLNAQEGTSTIHIENKSHHEPLSENISISSFSNDDIPSKKKQFNSQQQNIKNKHSEILSSDHSEYDSSYSDYSYYSYTTNSTSSSIEENIVIQGEEKQNKDAVSRMLSSSSNFLLKNLKNQKWPTQQNDALMEEQSINHTNQKRQRQSNIKKAARAVALSPRNLNRSQKNRKGNNIINNNNFSIVNIQKNEGNIEYFQNRNLRNKISDVRLSHMRPRHLRQVEEPPSQPKHVCIEISPILQRSNLKSNISEKDNEDKLNDEVLHYVVFKWTMSGNRKALASQVAPANKFEIQIQDRSTGVWQNIEQVILAEDTICSTNNINVSNNHIFNYCLHVKKTSRFSVRVRACNKFGCGVYSKISKPVKLNGVVQNRSKTSSKKTKLTEYQLRMKKEEQMDREILNRQLAERRRIRSKSRIVMKKTEKIKRNKNVIANQSNKSKRNKNVIVNQSNKREALQKKSKKHQYFTKIDDEEEKLVKSLAKLDVQLGHRYVDDMDFRNMQDGVPEQVLSRTMREVKLQNSISNLDFELRKRWPSNEFFDEDNTDTNTTNQINLRKKEKQSRREENISKNNSTQPLTSAAICAPASSYSPTFRNKKHKINHSDISIAELSGRESKSLISSLSKVIINSDAKHLLFDSR